MKAASIGKLVSFDKHYNKINGIVRLEPAEVLSGELRKYGR
jgi:hypothetical protein